MLNFTTFKAKLLAALTEAFRSLTDSAVVHRAGPLSQWFEQRLGWGREPSKHEISATFHLNIEGMDIVVTASEVKTPEGYQKSLRFLRSAGPTSLK